MATRITHTNNSDGHDGTYVYRSTSTMDPQALPAPIADEPHVALGAMFEYIDTGVTGDGDRYYRTQDHEGGQLGAVSDEVIVTLPEDLSSAQVGDYIGGGVYAGQLTISGADYHIIFALQSGELLAAQGDTRWKTSRTATSGTNSVDDGLSNTQSIEAAGLADHPAASYCVNYTDLDANNDYYLPSDAELGLESGLRNHPELSEDRSQRRWSSTTYASNSAFTRSFNGFNGNVVKDDAARHVRPIRRVPV